jgi:hypothetical protein
MMWCLHLLPAARPAAADREGIEAGGMVIYETFTHEQAQYGHPTNPFTYWNRTSCSKPFASCVYGSIAI